MRKLFCRIEGKRRVGPWIIDQKAERDNSPEPPLAVEPYNGTIVLSQEGREIQVSDLPHLIRELRLIQKEIEAPDAE
jgi:hypothetical protein